MICWKNTLDIIDLYAMYVDAFETMDGITAFYGADVRQLNQTLMRPTIDANNLNL